MLCSSAGASRPRARKAGWPAADCQPFTARRCLLPFPNNLFTRPDRSAPTGLRISLPAAAMPANASGQRIAVGEYDRGDGFSPGSTVILHVPGLDNAAAFQRTGAVTLLDQSRAYARGAPIMIIDERTGHRQLIFSELDAHAPSPQAADLLIHPGVNFTEGHTYVVVLRNLRNASGRQIKAPKWFQLLRDNRRLPRNERSQRPRYRRIFAALHRAGISRRGLYEAWDFTVASTTSLTSRLLAIRNDAFGQLGDHNLSDGAVQGAAPSFAVTSADQLSPQIRRVQGVFAVPCYLVSCGPNATTGFHYSSASPDALPTQVPGNIASAPFECIVPISAGNPDPARIYLYGHGYLSSHTEVEAGHLRQMATRYNTVFCATDWWGLAQGDVGYALAALTRNVNTLPAMADRVQQAVLNTLYLGRLMLNPQGLASSPYFQTAGKSILDTSRLYYEGISDGGILGGVATAVSPDFRHAVLGATGMNFWNLLAQRGQSFSYLAGTILGPFPDQSLHPVILDLMQQLWDRADPDGYAQQLTSRPLPDTPSHVVLLQIAYGDFQVSMYAAAIEARSAGAAVREPALDLGTNRARDRNLLYGIASTRGSPYGGSAIVMWDSGPGRVQPPPAANVAPQPRRGNYDPHSDVRYTPAAQQQKYDFLQPDGAVVDVCGGQPCRTYDYVP